MHISYFAETYFSTLQKENEWKKHNKALQTSIFFRRLRCECVCVLNVHLNAWQGKKLNWNEQGINGNDVDGKNDDHVQWLRNQNETKKTETETET